MDQASPRQVFAANVRRVRKAAGISQEKLAFLAGIDRSYMGAIERGAYNVSIDNMAKIARALGVGLDQLLAALDVEFPVDEGPSGSP